MTRYVHIFAMTCLLAVSGFTQPVNDNYTNRTILTGTDIIFSGTLAGATLETNSGQAEYVPSHDLVFPVAPTQTVWWEWTAPQTSTVIVEVLNPSKPSQIVDAVQIYNLENINTGTYVMYRYIDTRFPHDFFVFTAEAGTNYQIQLAGTDSASFDFRLIATNGPVIVEQPQTQTVTVGDSAMFGVVTAGLHPFGFQWQFNGTNLDGETFPLLGLNHLTTNQAGPYRVIITNAFGTNISQSANLYVTPSDTTSTLVALPMGTSNGFAFAISGEVGRRYRIQSSTNLTGWSAEASFAPQFADNGNYPLTYNTTKSVLSDTTGTNRFILPVTMPQKFFRTTPFHAINEECNNNLKLVRAAQLLFAYDKNSLGYDTVIINDLQPYVRFATNTPPDTYNPYCPVGGSFLTTFVTANPECTLHPFEER